MKKITLIIPEIHLVNFLFFFLLSFFYEIETYRITRVLRRWTGRRIRFMDYSRYVAWEPYQILRDREVDVWRDISETMKPGDFETIAGVEVDFQPLFLRTLKWKLEVVSMEECLRPGDRVVIVDDLLSVDLRKRSGKGVRISFLSRINMIFHYLNMLVENVLFFGLAAASFLRGWAHNRQESIRAACLYDGVSSRELSPLQKDVTFTWLIDDQLIRREDMFFLLPEADFQMKEKGYCPERDQGFLAAHYAQMNTFASRQSILDGFRELGRLALGGMVRWSVRDMMKLRFKLEMMPWIPFLRSVQPKVYVATATLLMGEHSVIVYLNAIGVKTIIWAYGTNSYIFLTDSKKLYDCRHVAFSYILSGIFISWNRHYADYLFKHPQKNLEIKVLGPLMSSDEGVMSLSRKEIAWRYDLPQLHDDKKYIAVFDSPMPVQHYRDRAVWYAYPIDEEYNYLFVRDLYRLVGEMKDVVLIFKPKRSLTSGKFAYSPDLQALFRQMENDPRVIMMDYNINPWVPFAVGDLFVSIAFESTMIAGLHYRKPSLFHDPTGVAKAHRYQDYPEWLTHDYDELKQKVHLYLNDEQAVAQLFQNPKMNELWGEAPGTHSTERFRRYLRELLEGKENRDDGAGDYHQYRAGPAIAEKK